MTSFTSRCLFEPPLLFDETGPGLWRVWRTRVIRRFAKKRNGFVGVEFSNFLTSDTLQILARESPRLNPPLAKRELFRSQISQRRRLVHALDLNTFAVESGSRHFQRFRLSSQ